MYFLSRLGKKENIDIFPFPQTLFKAPNGRKKSSNFPFLSERRKKYIYYDVYISVSLSLTVKG